MNRRIVSTGEAPQAIGPYSQAVASGNLLFISGQIGLDPESGELALGLEAQVNRALQNLFGILGAAGAAAAEVVKTTVYLASMSDFSRMNEIYARYFSESLPARSTVAAKTLPKDALFEIDAVAVIREE
jgi:2-iminobutanoate/2-iminopropanoate deaminase